MTLHLKMPSKVNNLSPKISVIGVGGAGGNIVNSMIHSNIDGVSFLNVNTDSQQLKHSSAEQTLQLGPNCTQGLGAGADPEIGKASAEEVTNEIQEYLEDANMVFLTAGMGGGTGTGASPVVARIARDMGILVVGVVTKPFGMEGPLKMKRAEQGIQELQKYVDNLIVIPNQNIFHTAKTETTFSDALQLANNVLIDGVRSIIDLMVKPGVMNHDFADVKAVMSETGKVHMGTGIAEGEERALKATEDAISNPLLENNSMTGARGVLINVTGGDDITLHEVDQAVNRIKEEHDENANQIWGVTTDNNYNGKFKISVISTGIDSDSYIQNKIIDISDNIKNIDGMHFNKSNDEVINESNNIEENNQSNFFVDLTNEPTKSNEENSPEFLIKELEDKARNLNKSDEKKEKRSIFSKIFGVNKPKVEKEIQSEEMNASEILSNQNIDKEVIVEDNNILSNEQNEGFSSEEKSNSSDNYEKDTLEINENHSSEEELLQIPAFLRRQAN